MQEGAENPGTQDGRKWKSKEPAGGEAAGGQKASETGSSFDWQRLPLTRVPKLQLTQTKGSVPQLAFMQRI